MYGIVLYLTAPTKLWTLPDPWNVLSGQSIITRPILIVVFLIDPGGSVFDCAVGVSILFGVSCGCDDDEY